MHESHNNINNTLHICAQRGGRERETLADLKVSWHDPFEVHPMTSRTSARWRYHPWRKLPLETVGVTSGKRMKRPWKPLIHLAPAFMAIALLSALRRLSRIAGNLRDVPDGIAKHMVVTIMDIDGPPKATKYILYICLFLPPTDCLPCRTQSQTSTS